MWNNGIGQISCNAGSCASLNDLDLNDLFAQWSCQNVACACLPNATFCGSSTNGSVSFISRVQLTLTFTALNLVERHQPHIPCESSIRGLDCDLSASAKRGFKGCACLNLCDHAERTFSDVQRHRGHPSFFMCFRRMCLAKRLREFRPQQNSLVICNIERTSFRGFVGCDVDYYGSYRAVKLYVQIPNFL